MKLKHKITIAYIGTLGIAITGTTIGLLVGHHYQQKALINRNTIVQEYALLNRLQVKILYNRPAKQISPYLQDIEAFQQGIKDFIERLNEIEFILTQYQQLEQNNKYPEMRSLFSNYQQKVADFAQKLTIFSTTVEPLIIQGNQSEVVDQQLIELVQSQEFADFIEFPDQLIDLTNRIEKDVQSAEVELAQAETFRTYITINSLVISMAIAALTGISLSRAIARQQMTNQAEREKAQQALKESHIRLQLALESANMIPWEWNPKTNEVSFDPQWKVMLGYEENEIDDTLQEWQSRLHPDDIQLAYEEINKHIKGETSVYENEHRIRCKDGSYKWNFARGKVVEWDQQGKPIRFIGIHYDISERKASELVLSELSKQLKKAQEVAHLGYWSFDVDTQKITWSDEVFHIYGLDPDQGEPSFEEHLQQYHPEDRDFFEERVALALQGIPQNFDIRIVHPNGKICYINSRVELHFQNEKVVQMFGSVIDITERRIAELELEQFFNLSLDLLCIADINGNFRRVNKGWESSLGYSIEQLEGKQFLNFVHPDDMESTLDAISELANGNVVLKFVNRYRAADGSYRYIEWLSSPQGELIYAAARDITDRKESEKKLRESEGIWRTLVDVTPAAIAMFDTQMQYLVANQAWYRQYGLENQEIIGRSHYEIFPDIPQHWKDIHTRCLTGAIEKCEADLWQRQDGNSDWLCWEIRPWIDRNGNIGGLLMYTEVITQIKVNEIALSALSKQLKKAQEVAHLGYWSFDIATQKITWSEEVFRIFGLNPEQDEPTFEESIEFYHLEDRQFFLEKVAAANQGIPQNFDTRIIRPDGEIRYINSRIELEFSDEQLVQMFGIVIDITDRKTEETLRSLLSRTQLLNHISTEIRNSLDLDTILQNAVDAIFAELKVDICSFGWHNIDVDEQTWEVVKEQKNPEFPSWIGSYSLTTFPHLFQRIFNEQFYCLDVRNSEDKEEVDFCHAMGITLYLALPIHTEGKIGAFELGRSQGDEPWQDDEIDLLRNIGNQVAIAIQQARLYQESQAKSQEIQRAYRELQETQIQLIQSEKMSSLGQLVAGVAHEINNPVSFIYGNLSHASQYTNDLLSILKLYQNSYPKPPDNITKFLEQIDVNFIIEDLPKIINSMKTGSERIRDIVKSLRTFSRLDEAELKAVDLHENIDSALIILQNRLNGRAGNPTIQIIKNYSDLPRYECYIGLLNQVLMNILSNAIQAIEEKQINQNSADYCGTIIINTWVDLSWIYISIQDNGIGMSPEVQTKIFNPFFTTKPIGQGTGMGLPTSYQIVTKNHQGQLSFTSVLGEGSEFLIQLPLIDN